MQTRPNIITISITFVVEIFYETKLCAVWFRPRFIYVWIESTWLLVMVGLGNGFKMGLNRVIRTWCRVHCFDYLMAATSTHFKWELMLYCLHCLHCPTLNKVSTLRLNSLCLSASPCNKAYKGSPIEQHLSYYKYKADVLNPDTSKTNILIWSIYNFRKSKCLWIMLPPYVLEGQDLSTINIAQMMQLNWIRMTRFGTLIT